MNWIFSFEKLKTAPIFDWKNAFWMELAKGYFIISVILILRLWWTKRAALKRMFHFYIDCIIILIFQLIILIVDMIIRYQRDTKAGDEKLENDFIADIYYVMAFAAAYLSTRQTVLCFFYALHGCEFYNNCKYYILKFFTDIFLCVLTLLFHPFNPYTLSLMFVSENEFIILNTIEILLLYIAISIAYYRLFRLVIVKYEYPTHISEIMLIVLIFTTKSLAYYYKMFFGPDFKIITNIGVTNIMTYFISDILPCQFIFVYAIISDDYYMSDDTDEENVSDPTMINVKF